MNQENRKTRMGKRLNALFNTIPDDTTLLMDLCCDHGALGRSMLESNGNCHVIFNDIHNGIMAELQKQLINYQAKNFELNIGPAQNICLPQTKHLSIILAGIGAEQCITILNNYFNQPQGNNATYIISPATKLFYVREFLVKSKVALVNETTVTENNRTYEILTVSINKFQHESQHAASSLSLFGDCWQKKSSDHINHITKLLKYYQAQQGHTTDPKLNNIIEGYKNILKKIS